MTTPFRLLIGERFNRAGKGEPYGPTWDRVYADDERYWFVMTRIGTFSPAQRELLRTRLGLEWDASMNLLRPSTTPGAWNWTEALDRGEAVLRCTADLPQARFICCGRRVYGVLARVLGWGVTRPDPGQVLRTGDGTRELAWVPHPSGLNRMWNDPGLIREIRERYHEHEERERDQGAVEQAPVVS